MLFNSYIFILIFLPMTVIIFYRIGSVMGQQAAILWLVSASCLFYAWWNPAYLLLLIGSISLNYWIGRGLTIHADQQSISVRRKALLVLGVFSNLIILGYFKYANFFVDNANLIFEQSYHLETIVLPLAISFFTFQQIAYLVDTYRGITHEHNFSHYCLFVIFFPQLIAGPVVQHKEMLPQFLDNSIYRFAHDRIAVGLSIFFIGLFKKVVIADSIALYSTPMFDGAHQGATISFFPAWGGALSYTFQLYFDFSGYSDMAVGLAYLFGIRLPLNFYSPYKATSIIEFWKLWHITLSRFLRDYLYIPLGGNRKGPSRRMTNLLITMLLGGLWHGAGWTFVVWGALHGLYLILNHLWRAFYCFLTGGTEQQVCCGQYIARFITFLAVVVAWVFFRADSLDTAIEIVKAMTGANGIILPQGYLDYFNQLFSLGNVLQSIGWRFELNVGYFGGINQILLLTLLLIIVWFLPNTYQILGKYSPAIDSTSVSKFANASSVIQWQPRPVVALAFSLLFFVIIFKMDSTSEFLYFQF